MRDEIDSCNYLLLRDLSEPVDNSLRVVVEEAKADGPPEDRVILGMVVRGTRPIQSDESCQLFEFIWPSYVAYCVCNELYTLNDESEQWTGRLFCVYSKSHFLDYVAKGTLASDEYPGPLRHWGLLCLNHIVDVVGCEEPTIQRLRPD